MRTWIFAWDDRAQWAARKLVFLMFALAANQLIANPRESFVLAVAGVCLLPAVSVLSLVARRPRLLLYAYLALVLNAGLLK